MREPLAYHLTWTCYGQWLQGDPRGYVDRQHHAPGEPYPHNNPQYYNASANRMTEPPCWLTDDQRRTVTRAVREAAAHRGWNLLTINAQPDHVHVAIMARGITGKGVIQALKTWATMCLNRSGGGRTHWWTAGGKVETIFNEQKMAEVIDYINHTQRFAGVE